ncbi:hypothetical protein [Dinoroseobacter sp. S124A]|uniref:hypothetical protein n=1 Tax=Dinoroseobacter sp. S124A TaxID=3415128 RepID=UPI003C7AAA2C
MYQLANEHLAIKFNGSEFRVLPEKKAVANGQIGCYLILSDLMAGLMQIAAPPKRIRRKSEQMLRQQ